MIYIDDLWTTQKNLKRKKDIPEMVKFLQSGETFEEKIELHECDDGEIQINNGHHRIVAISLSGRNYLEGHEYDLIYTDRPRIRFTKVTNFCKII